MIHKEVLQKRARYLRKTSTDTEKHLWYHIRGRRLGQYKFKRQVPIGNYIVDFVCSWKKLIVELDGGQHAETVHYDQKRTTFLESQGYKVLRFWNNEVLTETENVLDVILHELEKNKIM